MKCKKCGSSKLGLSQVVVVLHDILRVTESSITLDEGLVEWDTGKDRVARCFDCGDEFDLVIDDTMKVLYEKARKTA